MDYPVIYMSGTRTKCRRTKCRGQNGAGTKCRGQNVADKMVRGQNVAGQNVADKMSWIKWRG